MGTDIHHRDLTDAIRRSDANSSRCFMEMGSFQFEYPLAVQGRAKKFLISLVSGDICPKGLVGCRVMRENSNIQRFFLHDSVPAC